MKTSETSSDSPQPMGPHSSVARSNTMTLLSLGVLLYAAVAAVLAPDSLALNAFGFGRNFSVSFLVVTGVGLLAVAPFLGRHAPLTFIMSVLRTRTAPILVPLLLLWLGTSAFWTLKPLFPSVVAFYADPLFAQLDAVLHFGDPWRHLHAITPVAAVPFLTVAYFPLWFTQLVACLALALLLPDIEQRHRYLLSFAMIYLFLGTGLAIAASSVGPIFYDQFYVGERFAEFQIRLRAIDDTAFVRSVADRLYRSHTQGAVDYFAGISAMPSIHVAVATLNALYLSSLWRGLLVPAWSFLAITLFGSVYFGWHYALDGYVSMAIVVLIWRCSSKSVAVSGSSSSARHAR